MNNRIVLIASTAIFIAASYTLPAFANKTASMSVGKTKSQIVAAKTVKKSKKISLGKKGNYLISCGKK